MFGLYVSMQQGGIKCGNRDLRIHKMNKHQGITWPCKMCSYRSAGPRILSEHMRRVHSDNSFKKHKCPECNMEFSQTCTQNLCP